MKDVNKRELQSGDLFKFVEGLENNGNIYETFDTDKGLLFKGYSFQTSKAFNTDSLVDSKFEIIGTRKEGLDENSYDYVKRERMNRGEYFLDS